MNKSLPLLGVLLLGLPSLQAQPTTVFLGRNAVITTGTGTIALGDSTGKVRIVRGTVPTGPGSHIGGSIIQAANNIGDFFENITGVAPHITDLPGAITNGETRIILGESTGNPITAYPELSQTDSHGFLIKSTVRGDGGTDIHIISKSAVGIRFGALFFLYNYCGVRVIGSGTLGEIYEQRNPILVPNTFYVLNKQPDYIMRYWSGNNSLLGRYLMGDENGERRYDFGHMANHIYHPADYGDTSPNPTPEFYPVISGTTRYPQKDSNGNWPQANWQPTYSESIVTTRAIAWAAAKLVDKPHFESVSLTVNVSAVTSKCTTCGHFKVHHSGRGWFSSFGLVEARDC